MKAKNTKVSIIIPVMSESENIDIIVKKSNELDNYSSWELIFMNEGSIDNMLYKIKTNAKDNENIKYISFSKNFEHQNALRAGYDYAGGDCVICMDGDKQHPPELIHKMIDK